MRGRSTTDLLILMIAGTVCFAVLAAGATVAIIEIVHPESDTTAAFNSISDVINTLIGLLAGFLAGVTHGTVTAETRRRGNEVERTIKAGRNDESADSSDE